MNFATSQPTGIIREEQLDDADVSWLAMTPCLCCSVFLGTGAYSVLSEATLTLQVIEFIPETLLQRVLKAFDRERKAFFHHGCLSYSMES